jgi:hypothetical protein
MSNNVSSVPAIIPPGFDPAMAQRLAALDPNWKPGGGEMSAGVRASYAIVRYKGKVWSVAFGGEDHRVEREASPGYREPSPSLEVIVVRANAAVSKRFYAGKWVEGMTDAPDCKSIDGVKPDAGVKARQSEVCATCPQNAWGSKITEQGKQAKACSDGRRLALVPLMDIPNEAFGGPMLLTLPPASLQAAVKFEQQLGQIGYPPYAVATRLTFDPAEPFPSIVFSAIRALEPHEFEKVVALRDDPRTRVLLFDSAVEPNPQAAPAPAPTPASVFEQAPTAPPPVHTAPVQPAPVHVVHPPATNGHAPQASQGVTGGVTFGAPVQPAVSVQRATGMVMGGPVQPAPAPTQAPQPTQAPAQMPPVLQATQGGADLDNLLNGLLGGA